MSIQIRPARADEASTVAPLLLSAMTDIFLKFIGSTSTEEAAAFLTDLIAQPGNQFSAEHCIVAEVDQQIVGVACTYDGGKAEALSEPVHQAIKARFDHAADTAAETQAGEHYIDCIGVHPNFRGHGIGSSLLSWLSKTYVDENQRTLGLLVDLENPKAKRLYERLGFVVKGQKTLVGKPFEHMQFIP